MALIDECIIYDEEQMVSARMPCIDTIIIMAKICTQNSQITFEGELFSICDGLPHAVSRISQLLSYGVDLDISDEVCTTQYLHNTPKFGILGLNIKLYCVSCFSMLGGGSTMHIP